MKNSHWLLAFSAMLSLNTYAQTQAIPLQGDELFGSMKARQIGPALMSGRVSDIATHPSNNRILYIGTAGGGVWRSSDGGATFSSIFNDYCQSIGTVTVDPHDPDNSIWVGTGETWTRNSVSVGDGIYKSVDGGNTWQKKGLENSDRISNIIVHPTDKNTIYVGVLGALWGDSDERGVYKSNDGGNSWNKLLYVNPTTGCADLVMDPSNPNVLYASFWEFRRTAFSFSSGGLNSALYKSIDGGTSWNKIHTGFPKGKYGRFAVAIAPSNSNIVYCVLEGEDPKLNGLYRSDDAGANWKHLNSDFALTVRPFYFSRIVIDPKNPDVIAKGGLFGSISRDGGKTFRNMGAMHADIHDIVFDSKDSDRMYVATDGGLYRSWDGANVMEMVENLPISQFYHVSMDNTTPYKVYGGLQDNGSWYGPSKSPGGIEARDWTSIGQGDGFRVYPHPTQPHIMYSEMQGAENVWRYDANLQQIKIVKPLTVSGDPKLRFNWNAAISTSKHKPNRLFMGSQFLHVSDDMGDSWRKVSPDLTTNDPKKQDQENSGGLSKDNSGAENHCTIFTIAESPIQQDVIWVGSDDGNVQVTTDLGKTWSNVTANLVGLPKNIWCAHIEASNFNAGTAYAVFDGHTMNDKKTYVLKTTDYGKTWVSIVTPQIYGFARCIQEDLVNPNVLFLGTEFGLYITVDGGQNWAKFKNEVPATAIHYLDMHPQTNDLVIATHGRGIIILDDVSTLRQIKPEMLNSDVHFFTTKAVIIPEETSFGGASTETQFVGPNPSESAKIQYYLSKRHTFGKMSLEIFDASGKSITTLSPGKSKGINTVEWNFTTKIPKVAKGKTLDYSGFTSPRAAAGTYKAVLTKGNAVYETPLVIQYSEKSSYTAEDRKVQADYTTRLFNMTESLAYMVNTVDIWIDFASAQKDGSLQKDMQKLLAELNTLKNSLVITTGDNYVGSAEPQLREKIGSLYSLVANYPGRPTQAQIENYTVVENAFKKAEASWNAISNAQIAKLMKKLEAAKISAPVIPTKDAFLSNS